jgi:hypothetical protein
MAGVVAKLPTVFLVPSLPVRRPSPASLGRSLYGWKVGGFTALVSAEFDPKARASLRYSVPGGKMTGSPFRMLAKFLNVDP